MHAKIANTIERLLRKECLFGTCSHLYDTILERVLFSSQWMSFNLDNAQVVVALSLILNHTAQRRCRCEVIAAGTAASVLWRDR